MYVNLPPKEQWLHNLSKPYITCSKLLPFKNYEGHCTLWNLQIFFVAFLRSVPQHNPISEYLSLQAVPGRFLLSYAMSAVRPFR